MTQNRPDEVNLIDYAIILLKKKRMIVSITMSLGAFVLFVSLFLPNIYRAETRILPPRQTSAGMASQLIGQVAGGFTGVGGMIGVKDQTDLYVGMLQSRTVLDSIITRFDLKKLYDKETLEAAKRSLKDKIDAQTDPKSDIIVLTVEDKDPQRASDMANAFVEELRKLTRGIAVTEAAQRRLFFEEQLMNAKESLIKAEENMKGFQERTGAVQVEEQVKAVIKNIAQLRAEIAAKEVEIRVMRTYSTANNPDLQRSQEVVNGMKAELAKLELKSENGSDPLTPAGRMPAIGTEYARRLRDLKFNETLYELLLKQYEAAKLDEARDAAVVQVIDRAVPPEKKAKPKRFVMVLVAAAFGFIISVGIALFTGYWELIADDPENRERIGQLKKYASLDGLPQALARKWRHMIPSRKTNAGSLSE